MPHQAWQCAKNGGSSNWENQAPWAHCQATWAQTQVPWAQCQVRLGSVPRLACNTIWCCKLVWTHHKVKPKKGQPCLASAQSRLAHPKADLAQCQTGVASCQACLAFSKVRVGWNQASLSLTQFKVPHVQQWIPLVFFM